VLISSITSSTAQVNPPAADSTDTKETCGNCKRGFYDQVRRCIACDKCETWYHCSCVNIPMRQFEYFNDPHTTDE
jgi:hypothetical protein